MFWGLKGDDVGSRGRSGVWRLGVGFGLGWVYQDHFHNSTLFHRTLSSQSYLAFCRSVGAKSFDI